MDITIVVAIITALSTTIPQLISNYMNNKHQLKIKKIELFEVAKREAIINFLNSVGNCTDNGIGINTIQSTEYHKCLNVLMTYFPNLNQQNINKLNESIYNDNDDIQKAIYPIILELSKSLSEIR